MREKIERQKWGYRQPAQGYKNRNINLEKQGLIEGKGVVGWEKRRESETYGQPNRLTDRQID